jgi:hypothetical protein
LAFVTNVPCQFAKFSLITFLDHSAPWVTAFHVSFTVTFHPLSNSGEVTTLLVVTEFVPGRRVVLEGASGLMPRLEVDVEPADAAGVRPGVNPAAPDSSSIRGSNLSFKLSFRRSSALFQFSVSPLLSFLAGHQLRRSILMLRMMIP